MNPKVLETWLNETLQDAEHLDIPGCILNSENQNAMSRYGIDRLLFEKAGLTPEVQDRLYRGLFVYTVGFYEMINKSLTHIPGKFSIITALWKVFTILLEYCCRTDYRMLISEISKKNDQTILDLEAKFTATRNKQAQSEKDLKQKVDDL